MTMGQQEVVYTLSATQPLFDHFSQKPLGKTQLDKLRLDKGLFQQN